MTHEAIRNFDWTFTREYYEGDEEEYIFGGEKIQKTLRLFAREFDEIKSYIDNISNYNRITYDERSNLPDYFLTDALTDSGWDVRLVMPYDLQEVYVDKREVVNDTAYTLNYQLENSTYEWNEDKTVKKNQRYFVRQFSQVSDKKVIPYSETKILLPSGYFVVCGEKGDLTSCGYRNSNYSLLEASGSTYYDEDVQDSNDRLKYRIKPYTEEKPYTYFEINKEFLRRLKINSPYILRHKGTVESIEMILSMFGLKSRRWIEAQPQWIKDCRYSDTSEIYYDYDITEFSSFTNRIEEQWDSKHQMYRIDWLNSIKTISYDYRTVSNYNNGFGEGYYISYQGLPVGFRDEYEYSSAFTRSQSLENYNPYISASTLGSQGVTNDPTEAFREIKRNNRPVKRRYIYPQFNKDEQLDGNPYFQMDGGWLSKSIGNDNNVYNFQFDLDDNVVYTKKENSGYTKEDNTIVDDHPLFKETVRNIRMVDNIKELLAIPKSELYNGIIVYVAKVEKDIATIGNTVYNIKYEYNENKPLKYIELVKSDGVIRASFGMYFDKDIITYDRNGQEVERDVPSMEDGTVLKAYIFENQLIPFVCKSNEGSYIVNSFNLVLTEKDDTNYFLLEDVDFSDTLINKGNENWTYGWRRIKNSDCDFLKINTIENYYKGNNPHNGKMIYDSGHEYFTYFNRLFKHAYDNRLFNESCFGGVYDDVYSEINECGFNGLIDKNELIKQYTPFLVFGDTKIHYFGNYKTRKGGTDSDANEIDRIFIYGENKEKIYNDGIRYRNDYSEYENAVTSYTLADYDIGFENRIIKLSHVYDSERRKWIPSEAVTGGTTVEILSGTSTNPIIDIQTDENFKLWNDELVTAKVINKDIIDESTNQILNNKRILVTFYLHNNWYSNEGQTEVKYLDSIVMNYLTQVLPSTVIVDIYYKDNEESQAATTRTVTTEECVAPE